MASVKKRCKMINKWCVAFGSCIACVRRTGPARKSSNNIEVMAPASYNNKNVTKTSEDCGSPIKLIRPWRNLLNHLRFLMKMENSEGRNKDKCVNEGVIDELKDGGTEITSGADRGASGLEPKINHRPTGCQKKWTTMRKTSMVYWSRGLRKRRKMHRTYATAWARNVWKGWPLQTLLPVAPRMTQCNTLV